VTGIGPVKLGVAQVNSIPGVERQLVTGRGWFANGSPFAMLTMVVESIDW
jgi:hypothetical protein